jgi:methyl-accepting chemotaxis protein
MSDNDIKFGVTGKLVSLLIAFAAIPLLIIIVTLLMAFGEIKDQSATRFLDSASSIADKIDRSLFERYGDVQAFGLNQVIQDRDSWYIKGADNKIVNAMNSYVSTYGIYSLMILVDLNGDVIAVNSADPSGAKINSESLYSKNYRNSAWFNALKGGQYTTRMPFTAPGNDISSGTFIEDIHIDSDVQLAYQGDNGLTLGFSAPVYHDGKVVAFWSNRAKFSLVEEFFQQEYQTLKANGYPGAELTLLDQTGKIIVDYDPVRLGTEDIVRDFNKVLLKFNLATAGVSAAVKAVNGESGTMYALHARKELMQAAGFAHLKGALGFPGMNWSVLVRVPESEAAPWLAAIQLQIAMIIIICLIVVTLIGLWIGRRVVRVVHNIVDATESAASGNLTSHIDVTSKDEFGALALAFNTMVKRLSDVVSEVRASSQSIAESSTEISTGNADLSQRTEEQASNLEETAASMEQMTSTVRQNADNTNQANQLAVGARDQAEQGGDVVSRAISAMSDITASSKRISDIIGVIDEIAFQTNLLALNAAVEAARAGEQGRGFAVVAGEVRLLAGRSAEAAKEIKGLIQDSLTKVDLGSQLVDESGRTLTHIVESVKKVTDIIAEISASSREQASGIEEVNNAITQMDDMTQQNAALVEEAASASEAMSHQAQNLSEKMDFFTIETSSALAIKTTVSAPKIKNTADKPKASRVNKTNPMPLQKPAEKAKAKTTSVISKTPAAASKKAAPAKATMKASDPIDADEWEEF